MKIWEVGKTWCRWQYARRGTKWFSRSAKYSHDGGVKFGHWYPSAQPDDLATGAELELSVRLPRSYEK
jgi:hypothetical protein